MKKCIAGIALLFFAAGICTAQKKTNKKAISPKPAQIIKKKVAPEEKTQEDGGDKRKIKYLCYDESNIVVFFDNGRAALTNAFSFCEENLYKLFSLPANYRYEVINFLNEPVMAFRQHETEAATGIKLSKEWWYIKDFNKVREIKKCN